jgi:pimeloyl-ACP methyl ester carboxylesterase
MGEPLVLLPGMMCDARLFGAQIGKLSAELAIMVAPVTRGERVEEIASGLLDQLPQRFALGGLGLGGVVAMELLRRAPDRVTRIALIGTHPLGEFPAVAAAREPEIVKARSGRLKAVMEDRLERCGIAPGPRHEGVTALALSMARSLGAETFVRQSRALQRCKDQQATLRNCKVPALVLCGAQDMLSPVKRHQTMAELLPDSELVILEDAGHLTPLEQPEAVTAALRSWLKLPLTSR